MRYRLLLIEVSVCLLYSLSHSIIKSKLFKLYRFFILTFKNKASININLQELNHKVRTSYVLLQQQVGEVAEIQQITFMLQQQSGQIPSPCTECLKKQEMLNKFSQLVHLLRKKAQKEDQSRMKSSIHSQLNWVQSNNQHNLGALRVLLVVEKSCFRSMVRSFKMLQGNGNNNLRFIADLPIIKQLKDKQPTLSHSVASLQSPKVDYHQITSKKISCQPSMDSQNRFLEKIQIKSSPKFLIKKIFELTHENNHLELKLKNLRVDLQENIRRQEREIAKKRQSLQGLAQELSQKNQVIEELKETIKSLQNKLGAKDNIVLHRLLQEDGQSLRHAISKLQNINEKLNNEIFKVRGQKGALEKQNKQLSKTIENLKTEIIALKQSMFQTEHQAQQNSLQRRELELVSQKVFSKLEKVRKMEKKCNEVSRAKDSLSTHCDQLTISKSERKVETTLNSLQKTEEERVNEFENKLECVFTYLFNLQNPNYQLRSAELFDEEEKELLLAHKQKFIASMKAQDLRPITFQSKRQNMTDISLGDSLFEIFQEKSEPKAPAQPIKQSNNIKLMQFELERNKFIEKISEVKERELHMRCVVLQLLKSLEFRSLKKDTQSIVALLCDLFEYSEQERNGIVQQKSKKFFGLL